MGNDKRKEEGIQRNWRRTKNKRDQKVIVKFYVKLLGVGFRDSTCFRTSSLSSLPPVLPFLLITRDESQNLLKDTDRE